ADLRPLYPGSAAGEDRREGPAPRWRIAPDPKRMDARSDPLSTDFTSVPGLLRHRLAEEFQSRAFLRDEFPMLASWGVEDYSHTVHSLGLNYLAALGRHFGLWAVSEYPVAPAPAYLAVRNVRCDVVWFARPDGRVALLAEFERYEETRGKQERLRQKA